MRKLLGGIIVSLSFLGVLMIIGLGAGWINLFIAIGVLGIWMGSVALGCWLLLKNQE